MGSGKSTFATKLGKVTGIEVTHMDRVYHKEDWSHITREELIGQIDKVLKKDSWIIDGNYQHTIDQRLQAADTIIFFDIPLIICTYRAIKRAFIRNPEVKDKMEGLKDKVSWELIKLILLYNKNDTLKKLNILKKEKQVFIVKNNSDMINLLKKFKA